jgi:hypothetical protein
MADGSVRPSAADPKAEQHSRSNRRYKNLADRLLSNILIVKRDYETECWELLIGWKDRKGYIKISVYDPVKRKMVSRWAHRVAHELFNKVKIPDDLTLEHRCFNTSCIRNDHTTPMTRSQNSKRPHSRRKGKK